MGERSEIELLEACLEQVWNERDSERRLTAIAQLYHPAASVYEPDGKVSGHGAISDAVTRVLAGMPPGFRFTVTGPSSGHHGLAVTRWQGGPPGQVIVSGGDAARTADGTIREHWIYIDPPA